VLQCVESVLQCVESVLQCVAVFFLTPCRFAGAMMSLQRVLLQVAVCCNVCADPIFMCIYVYM